MKKYLVLVFLLISISSFAGVVMPIPIYMGGGGNWIRVAVLNGGVNSTTYMEGKIQETTIIVGDKPKQRVITAKEILSETDSIIVIRK